MPTAVSGKTRPDDLVKDQTVGDRARVLILDTQVDPHPYLTGRYIANAGSLLDPTDGPREWWTGHATFIAGLVVQRAPAVQLEIESVLTDAGATPSAWDLAISMVRCANRDVDVFNLSFGCFTLDGEPPLVLQRAVQRLTANTVVVAAAGNYGAEKPTGNLPPTPKTAIWPAAFEDVVAVGASRYGGERAEFSPDVPWVDLMAPGHEVESTYLTGDVALRDKTRAPFTGMATWSGTSFAAAAVSGAIAARTVRGERTAQEALADLRAGNGGESSSGIEVARLTG
jgi:subtilisin family serine protease